MRIIHTILLLSLLWVNIGVFAGVLETVDLSSLEEHSILDKKKVTGDPLRVVLGVAEQLYDFALPILNGIALIAIAVIASTWITSMGNDSRISEAKTKLNYTLAALIFINIPKSIYYLVTNRDPFSTGSITQDGRALGADGNISFGSAITEGGFSEGELEGCNLIFCSTGGLNGPVLSSIIGLLQVIMVVLAIFFFTWGGYETMFAGNDDRRKQGRSRLLYGGIALFVIGILETLFRTAFFGTAAEAGTDMAYAFLQLSLYFVAPVSFVFLSLGAYLIITSAGSEERMKRGRTIVINTIIATVLLLLSFSLITEIAEEFLFTID